MDELDAGLCVQECRRCAALTESRSQIVNGTGPPEASLLFIGEGPGATEDEEGEPFVGRSGDILDEALSEVGILRDDVRITNCVRCRPPDNRDPTTEELENCRGYLEAEVDHVDPDVIIALGKVPAEHLLGRSVAVTREAGEVVETRLGGRARRLLISVHPAATLYDRSQKETFEATIARAAELVDGTDGTGQGQSRLEEF